MRKLPGIIAAILISAPALADQHGQAEAELRDVVIAFNEAYADNDMALYFSYFAEDADMYWSGSRHTTAAYRDDYTATVEAGGTVEKNEVLDLVVRILPGNQAGVASFFIDYRFRGPDGEITVEQAFETGVWENIDGEWKLVGMHNNVIPPE